MRTSISENDGAAIRKPDWTSWIKARVLAEGFDAVGIALPSAVREAGRNLYAFLEAGFHGEMGWLAANAERRADPSVLWPDVRSIVLVGLNYSPEPHYGAASGAPDGDPISVYARGADYHDVIKGKLKAIAGEFARASGEDVKVFVDTAPVMEKPLAQAAGVGWQGKHTNLVSRDFGSWLFLGAIFTTAELVPDAPETDRCGSCSACLDACPTKAFPAPFRLDARRCISYLTIESKTQIPLEFRSRIGDRVYGCDACLAACPWNKFAQASREMRFRASEATGDPQLYELLQLDDARFRASFRGSPIKRIGRDRFVRNTLLAAGNSGDTTLLESAAGLLSDPSPLVRGMAVWAVRRLANSNEVEDLRDRFYTIESDVQVRSEWDVSP